MNLKNADGILMAGILFGVFSKRQPGERLFKKCGLRECKTLTNLRGGFCCKEHFTIAKTRHRGEK